LVGDGGADVGVLLGAVAVVGVLVAEPVVGVRDGV
jgi:hypothetical protein